NLAEAREARAAAPTESRSTERLGLGLQELTPELAHRLGVKDDKGVVVTEIRPESPAAQAGLAPGDVIREVNRQPVRSIEDVERDLARGGGASQVLLRIEREGTFRYVVLGTG